MEFIKLLLIGLLSTVSLLACGDDNATEPVIPPISMTINMPAIYKGVPTELTAKGVYENPALNKTLTTEPRWTIIPTAPSVEADFTLTNNILSSNKLGAKAKITAAYFATMDNKSIAVSNLTVESVEITPNDFTIIANKTNKQLKATATYSDGVDATNDKKVDITTVADWTVPTGTTTMTVDNIANKGLVAATSKTAKTNITASFSAKSNTATVTALEESSKYSSLLVEPADITLGNGLTKQLIATAYYKPVGSIDVTNLTTWVSADPKIATVENITNKGLVTAKSDSSTSVIITGTYGIHSDTAEAKSIPAPIFNSFAISGTDGDTVKIGETNQLQTTETIDGSSQRIKNINSSDYVCTVADGVTAIRISKNCLITGVSEIANVDILITNNKAISKTQTIKFNVTAK